MKLRFCDVWPGATMWDPYRHGPLVLVGLALAGVSHVTASPTILTEPQSQTNVPGGSVNFSVSATNTTTYTSGFNYGELSGWPFTNVCYTGQTAGTLNFSYRFGPLHDRLTVYYGGSQIYDTGYVGGSQTSYFTVGYGPGTNTSVTVIINEGNDSNHGSKWEYYLTQSVPIYYQWQFNGTNLPGFTNVACSLTNITTSNAGSYRVVASDSSGAITSAVATLTVQASPAFTQQPVGMTIFAGASSNLSVTAIGNSPLSYQWQRNGTNISGATTAVYAFTNAQLADAGNYAVIITNNAGSATSSLALVQVLVSPLLTNVSGSSTNFSFNYATAVGSTYVVEYKANLNDPLWTAVATNAGTGSVVNYSVNPTVGANRFYRVLVH